MANNKLTTTDKTPIYLSKMAPAGVDGRVWARVLKKQLLASKAKEPTDEELLYFAQVAQASQLDPTKREIYGIYRRPDQNSEPMLTIQTGIDGFRVAAERSGKFGGSREPEFLYDPDVQITVKYGGIDKPVPNKATVTVLKVIGDKTIETTRSCNWADFYPGEKTTGMMWRKFPEIMLAKCAEAQALRAAFPNVAQIYLEEEIIDATPNDAPSGPNMEDIVKQIKEAKSSDEVFDIVSGLSVDDQKKINSLAQDHYKELAQAEERAARKAKRLAAPKNKKKPVVKKKGTTKNASK